MILIIGGKMQERNCYSCRYQARQMKYMPCWICVTTGEKEFWCWESTDIIGEA